MPAQAGIQESRAYADTVRWIPACAGMTVATEDVSHLRLDAIAPYPWLSSRAGVSPSLAFHCCAAFSSWFSTSVSCLSSLRDDFNAL